MMKTVVFGSDNDDGEDGNVDEGTFVWPEQMIQTQQAVNKTTKK